MHHVHLPVSPSDLQRCTFDLCHPAAPLLLGEEWDLILPRASLMMLLVVSAADSLASENFRSRGRNLILASQRESVELAVRTIFFLIC